MDSELVEKIVAEVLRRLKLARQARSNSSERIGTPLKLVTEEAVRSVVSAGTREVVIQPGAIVTPLARDLLRLEKVRLVERRPGVSDVESPAARSVAVGADRRGVDLLAAIVSRVQARGVEAVDHSSSQGEYPDVALRVSAAVSKGRADSGIVVDGGGDPSALFANKVAGIRAVACREVDSVRSARAHLDANVLCLGASYLKEPAALEMVDVFLETAFESDRHRGRVREIEEIERRRASGV